MDETIHHEVSVRQEVMQASPEKADVIVLLPSSEEKIDGGIDGTEIMEMHEQGAKLNSYPQLNDKRRQAREVLESVVKEGKALEKLFKVKGKALEKAISINKDLTQNQLLSALGRYYGVVYKELDVESMNSATKEWLCQTVRIIDPLFGILRGTDFVPNFKLPAGSKLGELGLMETYFRDDVTEILTSETKGKIVYNLLPQAHQKMIDFKKLFGTMYTVEWHEGGKTLAHAAKKLKGRFIRYLAQQNSGQLSVAKLWSDQEGFRYDSKRSKKNVLVFSR